MINILILEVDGVVKSPLPSLFIIPAKETMS